MNMNVLKRYLLQTPFSLLKKTKLPSRPKFTIELEKQCEESFLHGGKGPGGQKINKCNSKVQLKHLPSNIVVTCQQTRSREQNRMLARKQMAYEIDKWDNNGVSERDQVVLEHKLQKKRKNSKRSRAKYSQINEENKKQKMKQQKDDEIFLKNVSAHNVSDGDAQNAN